MIFGKVDEARPAALQEYTPTSSEVNEAAFLNTWYDNPTVKGIEYMEAVHADRDEKKLTKEEATEIANEQKIQVKNIPEEGISEKALELLLERQRKAKERAEILGTAQAGFFRQAIPALAAGFLDPINIAADALTGFGIARLTRGGKAITKAINEAGSLAERTAIRGGIGAIEGVIGAAAVEPASYFFSQELGDDYGSMDSLQNIAFGTIFGAGLHMGAGAVGDAITGRNKDIGGSQGNAKDPSDVQPIGKQAEQANAAPDHVKSDFYQTAVANMLNDSDVDVAAPRQREIIEAYKELDAIDAKLKKLNNRQQLGEGNFKANKKQINKLKKQRKRVLKQLEEVDSNKTGQAETQESIEVNKEFVQSNVEDPRDLGTKQVRREFNRQIAEAIDNADEVTYTRNGETKRIVDIDQGKLIDEDGVEVPWTRIKKSLDSTADAKAKAAGKDGLVEINRLQDPETRRPVEGEITPEAPLKNSRFIDKEAVARADQELAEAVDYDRPEIAEQQAALAEQELRDLAEQNTDLDLDTVLNEANEGVAKAKEKSDYIRFLANCFGMRG